MGRNVIETMETVFHRTSNIFAAWTEASKVADSANDSIRENEKPPAYRECFEGMKANTSHPCIQCFRQALCASRIQDAQGFSICSNCATRNASSSESSSKMSKLAAMKFSERLLSGRGGKLVYEEVAARGMDSKSEQVLRNKDECRAWIKELFANTTDQKT